MDTLDFNGETAEVVFSARRTRIGIGFRDGRLTVYAPAETPRRLLERALRDSADAIERLRRRSAARPAPPALEFRSGMVLSLAGRDCVVTVLPGLRRPRLENGHFLIGGETPAEIRAGVETLYRAAARQLIGERVAQLAARHRIAYGALRINGASTRWGSCSARGDLNFSWKLAMCPEPLIDYVVAHELAHRRQMNHSAAFWSEVGRLCPNYRVWRRLLRAEEERLRAWNEI